MNTLAIISSYPDGLWWQAMTSRLSVTCLVLMVVCLTLLFAAAAAIWRMPRAPRRGLGLAQLLRDREGTATLEFAMVLPIVLFLALMLTQTTLVMGGNIFLHYAAFAAARSAIVTIPADYTDNGGEERDWINLDEDNSSAKSQMVKQAAVIALLPVSGRLAASAGGVDVAGDQFTTALGNYYAAYAQDVPVWTQGLAPDRLRYAMNNTTVYFYRTTVGNDGLPLYEGPLEGDQSFGPHEPITVTVSHRLNLAIPYVSAAFATGWHTATDGTGPYALVNIRCTLTNEGILNELPPPPPLQRVP